MSYYWIVHNRTVRQGPTPPRVRGRRARRRPNYVYPERIASYYSIAAEERVLRRSARFARSARAVGPRSVPSHIRFNYEYVMYVREQRS